MCRVVYESAKRLTRKLEAVEVARNWINKLEAGLEKIAVIAAVILIWELLPRKSLAAPTYGTADKIACRAFLLREGVRQ